MGEQAPEKVDSAELHSDAEEVGDEHGKRRATGAEHSRSTKRKKWDRKPSYKSKPLKVQRRFYVGLTLGPPLLVLLRPLTRFIEEAHRNDWCSNKSRRMQLHAS